jgi:hypothetical protein
VALKKRDYEATLWEMLLHEYRCAKSGDNVHKLGPNALSSLIGALKDLQAQRAEDDSSRDRPNLIELDEWVNKEKKKG